MKKREYPMEWCEKAYNLRLEGKSYKDIGKILGVSETRASGMVDTYTQHVLELEAIEDLRLYRNGILT